MDPRRYSHLKLLSVMPPEGTTGRFGAAGDSLTYGISRKKRGDPRRKVLGLLVPLGFAVAGFTPAAYRRRVLRRPSREA